MKITEFQARVLLNMVPGIGPVRWLKLQDYFGNVSNVFDASAVELCIAGEISAALADEIISAPAKFDVSDEIQKAERYGAKIVTLSDSDYPALLREIFNPPPVIYVHGGLCKSDENAIAVIGTRRPTDYGRMSAERISGDLAACGITVVSGLARGIDTAAHKAALSSGGRTIAVLGCGLGIHYPYENYKLEENIAKSGAVISEFPMGFPPDRGNFPRRNRLIAGLALGTVVVEAPQKSGALITAFFALEQGKEVFAVPGSIKSKFSRGPHYLIKQGAKLIENVQDILEEISPVIKLSVKNPITENNKELFFTDNEKKVLDLMDNSPEGKNIDQLKVESSLAFGELSTLLLEL
ncbi:MAG: DNA-processing protein DprA, partial [Elusimicrobiota bacterium]